MCNTVDKHTLEQWWGRRGRLHGHVDDGDDDYDDGDAAKSDDGDGGKDVGADID